MRRKLRNPYDEDINKCFACGPKNPIGLKLTFEESEDYVHGLWHPTKDYMGYVNVLHGGIIATLLDEIGAWYVSVKVGTAGVTSELKVKYLKPVFISNGDISLRASSIELSEKNIILHCELFDGNGKLCAEARSDFFLYPEAIAKGKFGYPGKEAFHAESEIVTRITELIARYSPACRQAGCSVPDSGREFDDMLFLCFNSTINIIP